MLSKLAQKQARELLDQSAQLKMLAEELEEKDRRLTAFFENSQDIFMIVNEQSGEIQKINSAFTRHLGWAGEEVTGRPYSDFVTVEDVDRTLARHEEIVETQQGDESTFVNQYRTKSGETVTLGWRSAPPANGLIYAVARALERS